MKNKRLFCALLALLILVTGCTGSKSLSVSLLQPDYWPTQGWRASSPEAQGMDSSLLVQMLEDISASQTHIRSVLVIRNGYLVTEAYFHPTTRDSKIHIQSVTKSVIGALVGIAVKGGEIKSADEKLLSFFPNRAYANPGPDKSAIQLKHLLSMSSGFDCQEFSGSGPGMEQSSGWVQYMLDMPVVAPPGETFGYCNGNAHLLSAIIEKATGLNTREFANQELFGPLGIPAVTASDWGTDPQGFSTGGYGLFLRPVDLAKFAFLYLHNGQWEGQQIISAQWVADSTTQQIQKPEGSGYGYLWTVYPDAGHYAALGLAGEQIHVYPSKNLIVIVTAELEAYAEAPEIESMLNGFILPAIQSDKPLEDNPERASRLQVAVEAAAYPIQPVPELPGIAREVSGKEYTLEENPFGWQNLVVYFEPGASTARIKTTGIENFDNIGLDNIFREGGEPASYLMRGRWLDDHTFNVEWSPVGNIGSMDVRLAYSGDNLEISVQPVVFGGQPVIFNGTR